MLRAGLSLSLCLLPFARAEQPVWLCVGSAEFQKAAVPLQEHRRVQGLNVRSAPGPAAEAVQQCQPRPDFILLLGDEMRGERPPDAEKWWLRAKRRTYHGWQEDHPAEFVSDMALGDLDADGLPDAPVGRIPARTPEQVKAAVEKILRWERREPSLADLSLPVWAGDPGFSAVFRDMALGFLFTQIRERTPRWMELWIMQGDERSPFCGWPVEQPALFNARLAAGGLITGMIGHGRATSWWSMDLAGQRLVYESVHAAALAGAMPTPPHIIFACATGSFARRDGDCLAEALFRAPGGPVLCVGATEDSHPLTNHYHSTALLSALGNAEPRFGEVWLRSLRTAHTTTEPDKEALVRVLEPIIIKKSLTTADLRTDHAMLYNIMGDPATRIFPPADLKSEISVKDGAWHWNVLQPPAGARLLVQRRGALPEFMLGAAAATREEAAQRMEEANAKLKFETVAELPAGAKWSGVTAGPGTLRLVATGKGIAVTGNEMSAPVSVVK